MNARVVYLSPSQELGSKTSLYDLSLHLNRMQKYLLLWYHSINQGVKDGEVMEGEFFSLCIGAPFYSVYLSLYILE